MGDAAPRNCEYSSCADRRGIENANGVGRLLKEGSTDEVVVCAVMLLINCYAVHDLEIFGGVDYDFFRIL